MNELKISIVMLIIEINSLEGIRFYSGFAAVWALTEGQKYIPGTSENLSLICRDENTHLALTQNILKNLRKKENEGFIDTYKKCMPDIEKRYIEVYNEELEWIDYLFSQGSYIGMNSNILKQYLTYITIRRMKGIGIKVTKEMLSGNWCEKNPLPWIDKYINMDLVEKLPQEEKVLNYVTGGVDQDIDVDNEHILAKEILGDLF
jgi:ribonucleoside-diphosphate reductase beta chain